MLYNTFCYVTLLVMAFFWKSCSTVAIAGLCIVSYPNAFSELAMTIVDLVHAPAKAREGEQY